MARKDFWDESLQEKKLTPRKQMNKARAIREDTEMVVMDGKFHPTKSTGLKVIVRIIMFVAAMAIALSLYIGYKYYSDRSSNGTYTTTYFDSNGFSQSCSGKIDQLINALAAVEQEESLLNEENKEALKSLTASYVGEGGNFSYVVYDADAKQILSSGDDAISRIESSSHFIKVSTKDVFNVETSVPESKLNKDVWETAMNSLGRKYVIYAAVDNNLTYEDEFYDSYVRYDQISNYFAKFKLIGIIAIIVFLIGLIFSCIATGRNKIHKGVKLTLYDGIPTEIAIIISLAAMAAILIGLHFLRIRGFAYLKYAHIVGAAVFYGVFIGFFLSIVRRIKSGEFIDNSIIYWIGSKINAGLNKLPKALKVIIIIVILVVINGGLIYLQRLYPDIKFRGIPLVFAISMLIFVVEFIIALCCIFCAARKPKGEEDEEQAEDSGAYTGLAEAIDAELRDGSFGDHGENSFDDANFGKDVYAAMEGKLPKEQGAGEASEANAEYAAQQTSDATGGIITEGVGDKTVDFTDEEVEMINNAVVNEKIVLADLTKEVRKNCRMSLKEKEVGVTLRTQADPTIVELERDKAEALIGGMFESALQYSARGSKLVVEIYKKGNKAIYIMKNSTDPEKLENVSNDLPASLREARRIAEECGGKLIPNIEGEKFKIGVIFDSADE